MQQETIGLLNPYNYSGDLTNREKTPQSVADQMKGTVDVNDPIHLSVGFPGGGGIAGGGGLFGMGVSGAGGGGFALPMDIDRTVSYNKNPDYYQGTIKDLNYNANVWRGESMQALLAGRQAAGEDTLNNLRTNLSQLGINSANAVPDPESYITAKQQLLSQLEQKYGPGFRTNQEAKGIIQDFENMMSQKSDINRIARMVESGQKAEDFLSSEMKGDKIGETIGALGGGDDGVGFGGNLLGAAFMGPIPWFGSQILGGAVGGAVGQLTDNLGHAAQDVWDTATGWL